MDDYDEWIHLMQQAKKEGVTIEEVRNFIQQNK